MLNESTLSEYISRLRDTYMRERNITAYDINNGLCDDFACDVLEYFGSPDTLQDLSNHSLMQGFEGKKEENDIWDVQLLQQHWPQVAPTHGLIWEDIQNIDFGLHVWICYQGKHYDAECPEGVENFFDLPLFKKYIEYYVKSHENEYER